MSRRFMITFDREIDGRYIAEIPRLPEVLPVYGATRAEARRRIIAAAYFHLASMPSAPSSVEFRVRAA